MSVRHLLVVVMIPTHIFYFTISFLVVLIRIIENSWYLSSFVSIFQTPSQKFSISLFFGLCYFLYLAGGYKDTTTHLVRSGSSSSPISLPTIYTHPRSATGHRTVHRRPAPCVLSTFYPPLITNSWKVFKSHEPSLWSPGSVLLKWLSLWSPGSVQMKWRPQFFAHEMTIYDSGVLPGSSACLRLMPTTIPATNIQRTRWNTC